MNVNTIILVDKDQTRKMYFIEKLKQKIDFSYTKIEALFQTIREISDKEFCKVEPKQYVEFLDKFLINLSKKDKIYLIDIDELLLQNANKLIQEHNNIIIIYLQKKQNEGKAISIDANIYEEVDRLIEEIVKRMMVWEN